MGRHALLTLAAQTDASTSQVAALLFYAFALVTVVSAWAIVVSQNIVRMAVYLLLTLGGAAGLYFMLHAELLAAIQLIVYAGGTLILIVFGVMLTSKNPFIRTEASSTEIATGVMVAIALAALMLLAVFNSPLETGASVEQGYHQIRDVGHGLLSTYLVPFEISAVLLLVVMIGAAYMARRRTD